MRLAPLTLLAPLLLAGCAAMTEAEFRAQSNFDICRLSMGGPYAAAADYVARERALNCTAYYGAITQRQQAENAVMVQSQRPLSYRR